MIDADKRIKHFEGVVASKNEIIEKIQKELEKTKKELEEAAKASNNFFDVDRFS